MFIGTRRFTSRKYREEVGPDGDKGGGASDGPTVEELTAQLASMTGERDSLRGKSDELLTEAKRAKTAKREAEETARKESEAKAIASNDYEQLFKSSETERIKRDTELTELKGSISKEKVNGEALKLASVLAEGKNVDLLKVFIAPRLKFTEDGLKVTDINGNLTVSSLSDLENEFKNNADYASLLKGNQSSGGGASGGSNSGGAAKTITRSEWNDLNPTERVKFAKSGGTVTN